MFGLAPGTIGLIISAAGLLLGVGASAHVLLHKRRPESAFGWVGVCLLLPVGGPVLYFLFGINRVRTRATKLRQGNTPELLGAAPVSSDAAPSAAPDATTSAAPPAVRNAVLQQQPHAGIVRSGQMIGAEDLVAGNAVRPLYNGEQAFPEMLRSIRDAKRRVLLSTYIFESNTSGFEFVDALADAAARGVEVRVLLDGVGELYSWPRLRRILPRRGIRYARFLPPSVIPPSFRINLRNHRKMLVVDEDTSFVGGINIGDRHLADKIENPRRVVDLHFKVKGPVTKQVEAVFLRDWHFASGETLEPLEAREPIKSLNEPASGADHENNLASDAPRGSAGSSCHCRTLADGPDEGIDRLVALLLSAIGSAKERIYIMTPYFLPPRELIGALQSAALRGLDVSIILPALNNLPYVHRATRHMLWELLRRDVKVYYQPAPFVHSKMLLVDDTYCQAGSANWDARSLRLNFELALEVFDGGLNAELAKHFDEARGRSRQVTLADVNGRPIPTKIIDGVCWLMGPYL